MLQMRKLRPEVTGRGWGWPLGLPLSLDWLVSVGRRGGGCIPGPGQGRPLFEPRWAGSS